MNTFIEVPLILHLKNYMNMSLELKKFSFLYGYNRILYVNDIPAITAILESFPVHDCTLSFSIVPLPSILSHIFQFGLQMYRNYRINS
ncbi:hypothetical protein Anas_14427 [Armadillidium nasatum]|uniref:Uncharacterized protein n=1 Tax=Armadillidium nasatum TaxID=96803 RepID=A0A5N5SU77_9CRUS|nr:hypothetical protein Anas_14427 [Armadillidium nasatum]